MGWEVNYDGVTRSRCTASGCEIYGPLNVSGSSALGYTIELNDVPYLFPSAPGSASQRLTTDGATPATLTWETVTAGGIGGTGNLLSVAHFNTTSTLTGTYFVMQSTNTMSGDTLYVNTLSGGNITIRGTAAITGLISATTLATQGGLIYHNGTNLAVTAAGTNGQVPISRGTGTPEFVTLRGSGSIIFFVGSGSVVTDASGAPDAPFALELRDVVINTKEGPTGAALVVDINENGSTVFSTNPRIADGATTEDQNDVFSDTTIAKGAKITLDIDSVGSTFAGERITIMLQYSYTLGQ